MGDRTLTFHVVQRLCSKEPVFGKRNCGWSTAGLGRQSLDVPVKALQLRPQFLRCLALAFWEGKMQTMLRIFLTGKTNSLLERSKYAYHVF